LYARHLCAAIKIVFRLRTNHCSTYIDAIMCVFVPTSRSSSFENDRVALSKLRDAFSVLMPSDVLDLCRLVFDRRVLGAFTSGSAGPPCFGACSSIEAIVSSLDDSRWRSYVALVVSLVRCGEDIGRSFASVRPVLAFEFAKTIFTTRFLELYLSSASVSVSPTIIYNALSRFGYEEEMSKKDRTVRTFEVCMAFTHDNDFWPNYLELPFRRVVSLYSDPVPVLKQPSVC